MELIKKQAQMKYTEVSAQISIRMVKLVIIPAHRNGKSAPFHKIIIYDNDIATQQASRKKYE
jgi:hypothetical protein